MVQRLPYYTLLLIVICTQLDVLSAQYDEEKFKLVKPHHRILKKEANFGLPKKKHSKQTEEFVKKLEYAAIHESKVNALEFGLVPVDLILLSDVAEDVELGIDDELTMIESELGEESVTLDRTTLPEHSDQRSTSLIYHGRYLPSAEHNRMVDQVIRKVKRDMGKRLMDPLYFTIHNKGGVRHSKNNENPIDFLHDKNRTRNAVGGGAIRGLLKLKRFGNSEKREEGDRTLVRSHFFFGPLRISMEFSQPPRIRSVNSTLASLAGHALFSINRSDNATTLLDFITDSPLEYEIRLRGSKNPRFQELSRTAITKMFRRDGRMETRLQRNFMRAVTKKKRNNNNNNKSSPGENLRTQSDNLNEDVEILDRFSVGTTTTRSTTRRRILDDE